MGEKEENNMEEKFVCQECGQELESAKTLHTFEDCEDYKALVGETTWKKPLSKYEEEYEKETAT